MVLASFLIVGSLDHDAFLERRSGSYEGDEVGCVDGSPPVLGGLDEFERHRDPGGPRAGSFGLAAALAAALLPDDGWYANLEVGEDLVVVFAGRVFRYAKGDRVAHAEAVAYAVSAGTPQRQIDWGE